MNLHQLRTPHPLRESDFAAIRARVNAEIARREERPWLALLLRFAFAASLAVLFVPYVKDRTPDVPVQVERRLPAGRSAAFQAAPAGRDAGEPAGRMPALRKPRKRARAELHAQADRIEIITEDPTIRIIWLTPKEKDS